MPDVGLLDYGGLGLVAFAFAGVLAYAGYFIFRTVDYQRELTETSMEQLKAVGAKTGDTNRQTAETLKRLADEFEKSQLIMRESFTEVSAAIANSNSNSKEWRVEERREHEQMLLDHREVLRIINGKGNQQQ